MSKVKEVISKELLSKILMIGTITNIAISVDTVFYKVSAQNSDKSWYPVNNGNINIHELAIKIVDKIVSLGYVASLTKIKEHWWCEFATENYYKNNGIMSHGSGDGSRDIDTKSDDVLSCAVKAYGWILENKGSK